MNREEALNLVKRDGMKLRFFSQEYKDDIELVRTAINNNAMAFQYASDRLKSNFKIVTTVIKKDWGAYVYVSQNIKKNKKFNSALVRAIPGIWVLLDEEMKKDRSMVISFQNRILRDPQRELFQSHIDHFHQEFKSNGTVKI